MPTVLTQIQTLGFSEHCVGAISYTAGAMWPSRFVTSLYDRMLADHDELFSIETGTLVEDIEVNKDESHYPAHGIDEFGIWHDNKTSFSISSYLSGALGLMFDPKTWGHDRGEARIKALWSGCMGFTTDLLPLVGRLDPDLTRRKPPSPDALYNEWIVAGFGGEGMVHAWLSGIALGLTIVGHEEIDYKGKYWRPPGRVQDWFPDQLHCSKGRLVASSLPEMTTML